MPSTNARLQDRAVGHAVDLTRYNNGVLARIMAVLNRSDARLAAQLSEALMRMEASTFTVERLEAMLASVRKTNRAAFDIAFERLAPELEAIAEFEVAYQRATLRASVPAAVQLQFPIAAVSAEQAYAAALARPFQGRLLKGWAANVEASRMTLIRNAVRAGFVEGQTTAQIIGTIRGTRALNYADGLLDRSRREVATVVQTALSHTAQRARAEFYKANSDLIKGVVWLATLDNKTTPECAVRDGLEYTADTNEPIGHSVPWLGGPGALHFNCRSVDIPITKSWRELGLNIDEIPAGQRASMDGQVPADLTYGEWFGRQSAARQDEIVGTTRGELFREGKVTFEKFSNDKGQGLDLDALYKREGLTRP